MTETLIVTQASIYLEIQSHEMCSFFVGDGNIVKDDNIHVMISNFGYSTVIALIITEISISLCLSLCNEHHNY